MDLAGDKDKNAVLNHFECYNKRNYVQHGDILMKAGFVQFAPEFCHYEKNLMLVEDILETTDQVDLLVLPELANSGYHFTSRKQAWENAEEVSDSRFIALLGKYCRKRNTYVATGFNEREGDRLFNSAVLIGPEGVVGKYQKIHLFLNEKDIFSPGEAGLPVFETPIGKIGLLVCFDWMFPEVWRILGMKGADVICHCSNLVLPGFAQRAVPIHALINHVFVITANRIGQEEHLTFTGMSTIADPLGNVVYQAGADTTEVRFFNFDLELARNKQMTPRNHLFDDRRPELYQELTRL
jgi:predicted amidohydrolase